MVDGMDLSFCDDCNRAIVDEETSKVLAWHLQFLLVYNLNDYHVYY